MLKYEFEGGHLPVLTCNSKAGKHLFCDGDFIFFNKYTTRNDSDVLLLHPAFPALSFL